MAKKVKGMATEIESGGLETTVVLNGYNEFHHSCLVPG
jgi:hypothetical protein